MSFASAQTKMIKYLSSDEFKERGDSNSTIKSVPVLQKIIKKGFITFDSQEGIISDGFNENTGKYYIIKERAYVTGFMKSSQSVEFVENINSHTNKIAFIVRSDATKKFYDEYMSSQYISNIAVTIQGASENKKDIELSAFTRIPLVLPKEIIEFDMKIAKIKWSDSIHLVACIDPTYGVHAKSTNGLYKAILKWLK